MATLKTCKQCDAELVVGENWTIGSVKSYSYLCQTCRSGYNKNRYTSEVRERFLKEKYGITQEDYDALLDIQEGGCKICGWTPPKEKSLCVDHCHDTGEVRGLLCNHCNSGLGYFRDNQEVLFSAIAYLEHTASAKESDPVWHPNPLVTEDPEAYFDVSEVLDFRPRAQQLNPAWVAEQRSREPQECS